MKQHHEQLSECIQLCGQCRNTCIETLFEHCLRMGGRHAEMVHVRTMADCIQICQTAADFMTRMSPLHASVCHVCTMVCEACAASCDRLEGEEMKRCADICRQCAKSCREMSQLKAAA